MGDAGKGSTPRPGTGSKPFRQHHDETIGPRRPIKGRRARWVLREGQLVKVYER